MRRNSCLCADGAVGREQADPSAEECDAARCTSAAAGSGYDTARILSGWLWIGLSGDGPTGC